MTETTDRYIVTRTCCTSGQCVDCHTTGVRRARVVHADNLDKSMAERMVRGWSAYDAKMAVDTRRHA